MQPSITIERTRRIKASRQHVFDTLLHCHTPGTWQRSTPDKEHSELKEGDQLEITVTATPEPVRGIARASAVWPGQYLAIELHCETGVTLDQQWFFADATEGTSNVKVVARIKSWEQPRSITSESVEAIASDLEHILDALAVQSTEASAVQRNRDGQHTFRHR